MSKQRKLGLCWGENGIALVEVNKDVPTAASVIPFAPLQNDPIVGIKNITEDIRLLDLIQTAVKNGHFSTVDTYFSIPSKDIILRWFVIPWMKSSEIQGVVSFEAKKHIPFPLEELVYNYYPATFTKDGVRQIGVVFVGIRKGIFASYTNVLRQAGLNVVYSEPASMSLVRALVLRKQINTDQVTAVLNLANDVGEISITSQGYVKFIRDFRITVSSAASSDNEKSLMRAKLFNEVKMSLDFFSRQHADAEVDSVITLSSSLHRDIWDGLGEDLGMPVRGIDPFAILEKVTAPEAGHINAFGAGLSGAVPSVIDFNLSEGQESGEKKKTERQQLASSSWMLFAGIGAAAVSAVIFLGAWVWTGQMVAAREREQVVLTDTLGRFSDMSRDDINTKKSFEEKKFAAVKSLMLRSTVVPFIMRLTKIIPEGIWFEEITLSLKEGKDGDRGGGQRRGDAADYILLKTTMSLAIQGYAYQDNTNAEFQTVNRFLDMIKSDAEFSKIFKSITLGALQTTNVRGVQATSFSINCE